MGSPGREREQGAQPLAPGAYVRVEWAGGCSGEKNLHLVRRGGGVELRLCGRHGSYASRPGIWCQFRCSGQERRHCGLAATAARPVGRALELGGQFLIRLCRRLRPVPRDPLRRGLRIGCLGQCTVHGPPILHRGGTVDG